MSDMITKRLREGNLLAEVQVSLIPDDNSWGPYLSLEDVRKLERVMADLRRRYVAGGGWHMEEELYRRDSARLAD
jgi:hypothetical protein